MKSEDFNSFISIKMINTYDIFSKNMDVTEEQILQLIQKCLQYNPETTYKRQICNVFTIIEYWKNPNKFDALKQNWKSLMKTDR